MTAALIIACGKNAGDTPGFEPQMQVGTITSIQRIISVFNLAGVERIVVVCDGKGETEKLAAHMSVVFIYNQAESDMLGHIKAGLNYLKNKCTAAIVTHVGVPLFSVDTVHSLIASDGQVCVPAYNGAAGYPILLRSEHFLDIISYTGEGGLTDAVLASALKCSYVAVEDEGVLVDLRQESDYEHLLPTHSLMELHPDIRVRLAKEKTFYGPGAHQLLQLLEETHSLREACHSMAISYSKGRKIISTMEEQLGYPVIDSRQGGRSGGYSTVTEEGKKLMLNYSNFYKEAKQSLLVLFEKHFQSNTH